VKLKDGFHAPSFVQKLEAVLEKHHLETKYVYQAMAHFKGFSAKMSPLALNLTLAQDAVEFIEEDQIADINDCLTQNDPDWGTARTNQRGSYDKDADQTYHYTTGHSGKNVDAYIIDTGIYCDNVEFTSKTTGTCTYGTDTVDGTNVDGNGHGTHCAGTVAGTTYGIAKEANLIAVRVLNDKGSGSYSGIIQGIDWVIANQSKTRRSTANLSLGGGFSEAINDAVESAVTAGIVMNVAAGNDNKNACDYSPASAPNAITVGATDNKDYRASYSNYGNCLDVFGPGTDITSSWIGSPTATKTISGTSMATPQVCGVTAKYLSEDSSLTVSQVTAKVVADATKDVLKNVNGGVINNKSNTSPNLMVYGYCT
jgi:subtilisin family serine protease